ncbi:MAG: type II secretion system protein [Phycisphaerales bacterium]
MTHISRIFDKRARAGFTLIEVVMVVSIIALLAAISLSIGSSMVDSGRQRSTEGVLQVLDKMLDQHISATGAIPTSLVRIEPGDLNDEVTAIVGNDVPAYYPAIDGITDVVIPNLDPDAPIRHYRVNSVGLFLISVEGTVDVDTLLSGIDNRFVTAYEVDGDLQPEMRIMLDAWGNPIRYVHPKFDGVIEDSLTQADRRQLGEAGTFLNVFDTSPNGPGFYTADYLPQNLNQIPFQTVRRNKILRVDQEEARSMGGGNYPIETDSDGGVCPSERPYFYSAGPDGDPSTTQDNVYTTVPDFINPLI